MTKQESTGSLLMKKIKKNQALYLSLMLCLFCVFAGFLLGVVYENTKDMIAAKKLSVTLAAYKAVLGGSSEELYPIEIPKEFADSLMEAYETESGAMAFKIRGKGYQGDDIELAVGYDESGSITGVTIISHSETAGLGANAAKPAFINQYVGRDANTIFTVTKTGAQSLSDIDALSGATKTSNGVTNAVNRANEFWRYLNETEEEQ